MLNDLLAALTGIHLPDLFNPYTDYDPEHDRPTAAALRRRNLLSYLEAMQACRPNTLWIAESGSHTGTRRSGLPLIPTTEIEALNDRFVVGKFQKPTATPDKAGMTAGYVWGAALKQPQLPLFWNAVMAQPHRPGQPYRNRPVRRAEIKAYGAIIELLVGHFAPSDIVAIGRVAERALTDLGVDCRYVRHPAQGGAAAFREGIDV